MRRIIFAVIAIFLLTSIVGVSVAPHLLAAPLDYKVDIGPLPQPATGPNKIRAILSVVFGALGAVSLLMVTIGGFRYITSEGDPQAASRAKGTIVYALIGLVVAICAVAIVTFVMGRV